ncbi:pentapeptide repeat-containing protein [Actinomyces sp. ZJ308]|uniref:pentapeptide repeat-containing protein n=1 Tax=Actinomyces sp. ZJ308 TaxID=2708342 RepID=UPI001422EAED|nr:pentapeptide repeat-containing protein [Actinomyces sp. ZJ308]
MTAARTDAAPGASSASSPRPPVLKAPDLSRLRDGAADELVAGEMVEDLQLAGADLTGADLSAIRLLSCELSEVFADDTDLSAARLVDCRLERLSSTYLHSPRSTWRTVELTGSRIGAWELYDADVESLLIEDCRLGFANLAGTGLRDVLIRATRIDELDLSGVEAQRVRFEESRVGTLRLRDGSLADVDLRGLEMRSVSGVGSLGGATVSGQQLTELAPLMAAHLGLRVEDEDRATTSAGEEK